MFCLTRNTVGFPCSSVGKETACNVGDLGLVPGLGRFPWRRERLLTPVFWPGEFHGLYSPWGHKESDTTELLSFHFRNTIYPVNEFLNARPTRGFLSPNKVDYVAIAN